MMETGLKLSNAFHSSMVAGFLLKAMNIKLALIHPISFIS